MIPLNFLSQTTQRHMGGSAVFMHTCILHLHSQDLRPSDFFNTVSGALFLLFFQGNGLAYGKAKSGVPEVGVGGVMAREMVWRVRVRESRQMYNRSGTQHRTTTTRIKSRIYNQAAHALWNGTCNCITSKSSFF